MESPPKNPLLAPLPQINNLLIITQGGATPILLDIYDDYLNTPIKIVKLTDIINYLDIIENYHGQFPTEKHVLNAYLKLDKIILGFNDYLDNFGSSDNENYLINSNTGKVKITLKEYMKYLLIMNPQYSIVPFEFVPNDAGKKRVQRFLSKINYIFHEYKNQINNIKNNDIKLIIPYYLDFSESISLNNDFKENVNKCNGILIFTDEYKNANYEKIIKYKNEINKIKNEHKSVSEMIIKANLDTVLDLIIGLLINCNYFEIKFPYNYAQEGKLININFDDFDKEKNYGKIENLENFDYDLKILNMNDKQFENDNGEFSENCKCFSCLTQYKRSYLHHLFKCQELNGPIITCIHNCYQIRELYKNLNERKNDEELLKNYVMWFLETQCVKSKKN